MDNRTLLVLVVIARVVVFTLCLMLQQLLGCQAFKKSTCLTWKMNNVIVGMRAMRKIDKNQQLDL